MLIYKLMLWLLFLILWILFMIMIFRYLGEDK